MTKAGRVFMGLCLIFLQLSRVCAQDRNHVEHQFYSEIFGADRTVRLLIPEEYYEDSTASFAMTYVLDAQSDRFWGMASNNIAYLQESYCVFPMIAVGIVSDDRGSEFSPESDQLRRHLKKEVFPLIEKEYRTLPFRTVIGHSWGGAFVGATLFSADSDMFDAYIGVSPSLDAHNFVIISQADSMLQAGHRFPKYFYCSSGDLGVREVENLEGIRRMDSLVQVGQDPSMVWEKKLFEGKGHWGCVIPSLGDGLLRMSRNYFADQEVMREMLASSDEGLGKQLKAFYARQEKRFGFVHRPGPQYYIFAANDFRNTGEPKAALELYLMAREALPDNVTCSLSIGDLYSRMGEKEKAKTAYNRTLAALEKKKADLPERFYNGVKKAVSENLAKLEEN